MDDVAKELINGIAVVIDDEVKKEGTDIYRIVEDIRSNNIPVLTFDSIPDNSIISSLNSISFAVLDWDFKIQSEGITDLPDRLEIGGALVDDTTILKFLESLLKAMFIPVFIFTTQGIEDVKADIDASGILQPYKDIIQVKAKDDLKGENAVLTDVFEWIRDNASLYALKSWEKQAVIAKTRMFRELYSASPNWVPIIHNTMCEDGGKLGWKEEFYELLTRNFSNRIEKDLSDLDIGRFHMDNPPDSEEIRRVIQGGRYISYMDKRPKGSYCGELLKDEDKYYLNIRAQCNLSRDNNPEVYLIEGKEINSNDIGFSMDDITLSTDKFTIGGQEYLFSQITQNDVMEISSRLSSSKKEIQFSQGQVLTHVGTIIETCIANVLGIQFNYRKFHIEKFNDKKDKRIGRILAPNITRIQQGFASYIVREGIMSIPEEVLK